MNNFYVRDYTPGDYNGVINVWTQTGMGGSERGDDDQTIRHSIDLGGRLLLLVNERDSEIVGTSWMTFDGRRIHMHHFGILPYYQGQGLSKQLLRSSLSHVREQGIQVKLEVHKSNQKAINLYTGSGFSYLGDYDVYIIRDTESIDDNSVRIE